MNISTIIHALETGAPLAVPGEGGPVDIRTRPDLTADLLRDLPDAEADNRVLIGGIYKECNPGRTEPPKGYGMLSALEEAAGELEARSDLARRIARGLEGVRSIRANNLTGEDAAGYLIDVAEVVRMDLTDAVTGPDRAPIRAAADMLEALAERFRNPPPDEIAAEELKDALDRLEAMEQRALAAERQGAELTQALAQARAEDPRTVREQLERRLALMTEDRDNLRAIAADLRNDLDAARRVANRPPAAAPTAPAPKRARRAPKPPADLITPALKVAIKYKGRPAVTLAGGRAFFSAPGLFFSAPAPVRGLGAPVLLEDSAGLDWSDVRAGIDGLTVTGPDGRIRPVDAYPDGLEVDESPRMSAAIFAGRLTAADLPQVAAVRYASSTDESKPELKGIRFQAGHVVATDGRRLAFRPLDNPSSGLEGIAVPSSGLVMLAGAAALEVRLLPVARDAGEPTWLLLEAPDGRRVTVEALAHPEASTGHTQVFRSILETRNDPSIYVPRAQVHRADLEAALKKIAPVAKTVNETIRLTFSGDALTVDCLSSKAGRLTLAVPAEVPEPYACSFNRAYLLEAVKAEADAEDARGFIGIRSVSPQKMHLIGAGAILMPIRTGVE